MTNIYISSHHITTMLEDYNAYRVTACRQMEFLILDLRKDRGMSRASLAKRLDVSKETVYRYEDNLQDPALNRMKRNNGLRSTSLYGCLFITDSGV